MVAASKSANAARSRRRRSATWVAVPVASSRSSSSAPDRIALILGQRELPLGVGQPFAHPQPQLVGRCPTEGDHHQLGQVGDTVGDVAGGQRGDRVRLAGAGAGLEDRRADRQRTVEVERGRVESGDRSSGCPASRSRATAATPGGPACRAGSAHRRCRVPRRRSHGSASSSARLGLRAPDGGEGRIAFPGSRSVPTAGRTPRPIGPAVGVRRTRLPSGSAAAAGLATRFDRDRPGHSAGSPRPRGGTGPRIERPPRPMVTDCHAVVGRAALRASSSTQARSRCLAASRE